MSQYKFPYVSWEQVMDFDPLKPETATASPVLNAFLEAIPVVRPCDLKYIAKHLGVPPMALAGALICATGITFSKFLDKWRLDKLAQLKADAPELKGDRLAQMLGFYDRTSLWLFMKRKHLLKVNKKRSPQEEAEYWNRVFNGIDRDMEEKGFRLAGKNVDNQ